VFRDILHIGSHFGQERFEYEKLCTGRIIWVEADPRIFEILNTTLNAIPVNRSRHFTLNAFVTSKLPKKVYLKEFSNEGASNSIYSPNKRFKKYWPDIQVVGTLELNNSITLDEIVSLFKIDKFDNLLVLDTQGHEFEIIKDSKKSLNYFEEIICELTRKKVYRGQPSYKKTVKIIESAGFQLISPLQQNHFDGHFKRIKSTL